MGKRSHRSHRTPFNEKKAKARMPLVPSRAGSFMRAALKCIGLVNSMSNGNPGVRLDRQIGPLLVHNTG